MPIVHLRLGNCSCCGPNWRTVPSLFYCRAFSSIGFSSKSKKSAPSSQNPREEIRRLDDEIRRLEKERRSFVKPKRGTADAHGKSLYGAKRGYSPYGNSVSSGRQNIKPSPVGQNAKFASSGRSIGGTTARALANYEQEDAEEVEDGEEGGQDNLVIDEDEEFFSDAENVESSDAEQLSTQDASKSASLISQKSNSDPSGIIESSVTQSVQVGTEDCVTDIQAVDPVVEVPILDGIDSQSSHVIKHPWNEWNAFNDVLARKDYFKDELPVKFAMEGKGYLQFQSSAIMKRAILEFSRERDDIIRFLTKKHIKTVVAVGCPSTDRKAVNACKRLRVLCEIPEDEVCQQCKLKTFCTRAFSAPSPDLLAETVDVARVLYSFALNASPIAESQVSYPVNVVKSACHLVNEIVQLSAYPKDPGLPALKSRLPVKQPIEKRDDVNNHRAGDWNCANCNFQNFAKNRQCRQCGTSKGSEKQLEPGDWECPKCTFVNFRRNSECRECSTPRSLDASGNDPLVSGEWKCPECHFVNFRRNNECRKCSTPRPKGMKIYDDEDLEPGDWLCPECNFKNFKRNKNCKECGTVSPDQGKRDDRWGLKKSVSSGGWGSTRDRPSVKAERGVSSDRKEHEEWTPDFNRKVSGDLDEDFEEDADLVFGSERVEDNEGILKPSRASEKKKRAKVGTSQRKDVNDKLLSDFHLNDLSDLPKISRKKPGGNGKKSMDPEDDDDDDMEEELGEDERSVSKPGAKLGRGFLETWDDGASDDDDLLISRAAVKGKSAKGRGLPRNLVDSEHDPPISRAFLKTTAKTRGSSRNWDDSDDDGDLSLSRATVKVPPGKARDSAGKWDNIDNNQGFSDDDDIDIGGRKRGAAFVRGHHKFGISEAQQDGRFGLSRGYRKGESHDYSFGRPSSCLSEADDGGLKRRGRGADVSSFGSQGNRKGERDGSFNRSQGRGRGDSHDRGGFNR